MSEVAPAKAGKSAAIAGGIFVLAVVAIILFDREGWYEWVKALHVISVISWMVGQLYLPRLFVYHADAALDGISDKRTEMLSVMEKRLLKVIMTPAMIVSWVTGLTLVGQWGFSEPWVIIKLLAVVGLTVFHFWLAGAQKNLAAGVSGRSANFWRALNEIPTVLLIVIVIMVIVKPF
jgi:putative membrane protein